MIKIQNSGLCSHCTFIPTVLDLKCPNEARHVSSRAHPADSTIASGVTSPLIQHGEHLSCALHTSCALEISESVGSIELLLILIATRGRDPVRPCAPERNTRLYPQQTWFRSAHGELSTCGIASQRRS